MMFRALALLSLYCFSLWADQQPNVIIVLTDDQGYGDFGCKGNPIIQTPHLDAMAKRSFEMERFYVSPVCSPTRASLMTGRDFYRTGVTDTFKGRSIMRTEEVTLAEMLKDAGYTTGLFGKWHLGDNYPCRPMDQGFDHALYHMGGGIGQPSEPKGNGRRYTDAILFENGVKVQTEGYCCDVYFDEAIDWFEEQNSKGKPFFAYIASNTPHSPYHDVPQAWLDYYMKRDLSPKNFPQEKGHPIPEKGFDQETLARIYAMISNIDDNMGKLYNSLKREGLLKDTIVLFFNDNGPNTNRYVGGFHSKKGSHREAGIRSPIWWQWPGKFEAGGKSSLLSAHLDIMPTLADLCGATMPSHKKIDGRSIAKTLLGGQQSWDQRTIFLQWHRGEKPEAYNNTSIVQQHWKLESEGKAFYHMKQDPYAQVDVSSKYPEKKSELMAQYEAWLKELDQEYPVMWEAIEIELNHEKEPLVVLTNQEKRNGFWYLKTPKEGVYQMSFNVNEDQPKFKARVVVNGEVLSEKDVLVKNGLYLLNDVVLKQGLNKLNVELDVKPKIAKLHHVFLKEKQ